MLRCISLQSQPQRLFKQPAQSLEILGAKRPYGITNTLFGICYITFRPGLSLILVTSIWKGDVLGRIETTIAMNRLD